MAAADTLNVGIGVSTEKDIAQAVKEAMLKARSSIYKEKVDLAIVFSSINFARPTAIKIISNLLGPVPIIGASGAAVLSNQGILKNGLSIVLISFPKMVSFNTALIKDIGSKAALTAGQELGKKLLDDFHGIRRDLGIIFSDGLIEENSGLISGLQERFGTSFPMFGASASDDLKFLKTYIYFNQEIFNDAACGMLLGGKLNFGLGLKHGWKPLGKPRQITSAKNNIIHQIDNLPAVKIYEDYLARNVAELRKELKRISIFYPIGIHLTGEKEYLLRNLHSIENDGSLVCQGNTPEGSQIRLMIGTRESCLAATQQAAEETKKNFPDKKIGLALVFDSISRYILLGRNAARELEIIKERLGKDTPIAGIYTYGEQAPLRAINYQGKTYCHNQTIAILGIGG